MVLSGTRVVAVFQDDVNPKKDNYFAGLIAEPMSLTNNYRYLVFFDDGYAQYVNHSKVFICIFILYDDLLCYLNDTKAFFCLFFSYFKRE